jgi:hypothetical protein
VRFSCLLRFRRMFDMWMPLGDRQPHGCHHLRSVTVAVLFLHGCHGLFAYRFANLIANEEWSLKDTSRSQSHHATTVIQFQVCVIFRRYACCLTLYIWVTFCVAQPFVEGVESRPNIDCDCAGRTAIAICFQFGR